MLKIIILISNLLLCHTKELCNVLSLSGGVVMG